MNILKNTFTKAIALTIFLSFSVTNAQGVFISEYGEGSGNNKWLEIYNNSGADVDLSEYSVSKSTNSGQQWSDATKITLSGTLASGAVYVLVNNQAVDDVKNLANLTNSNIMNFNGDDAVALLHNDAVIDVLGTLENGDPGSGFSVAGESNATKDNTLKRKPTITTGNTNWASSAGTSSENSEWIITASNDFTDVGTHTVNSVEQPVFSLAGTWETPLR